MELPLKGEQLTFIMLKYSRFMPSVAKQLKKCFSTKENIKAYLELSKFRLSSLVVFTSSIGYVCAGVPIDWVSLAAVSFGTGQFALFRLFLLI